jgi:hypothetical protein
MFTLMLGLSATGIAAGVGMRLAASSQRQRKYRRVLGLPEDGADRAQSAQFQRAISEYAAVEARIRERSPHLSETQRQELAVNLVRARGLLPARSARVH